MGVMVIDVILIALFVIPFVYIWWRVSRRCSERRREHER